MKRSLLVACLATVLFTATTSAAGAVSVNGLTIDGQSYSMMLYGGQIGMQEGRVIFMGDRARVYLANGTFYSLRLTNNDIGDPNFIYATAPDGQTYRLQLKGSLPGYGPMQDVGPIRPHPGSG